MTITELGAIGELVGGVAVLATLIYLAGQVRSGALEAKAALSQAMTEAFARINFESTSAPELIRISRKGMEDWSSLDADERHCFSLRMMSLCQTYDAMLLRERLGLADAETVRLSRDQLTALFQVPGNRQWWPERPFPFSRQFTAMVDSILASEA